MRDISRIHTKVRLLTGVYVLKVNRSAFYQNQVSPTCLLCKEDDETTEHFILHCSALNHVRQPVPEDLKQTCINLGIEINFGDCEHLLELILDCTSISSKNSELNSTDLDRLERQSRRLCHVLHTERFKRLPQMVTKRKG